MHGMGLVSGPRARGRWAGPSGNVILLDAFGVGPREVREHDVLFRTWGVASRELGRRVIWGRSIEVQILLPSRFQAGLGWPGRIPAAAAVVEFR